MVPDHLRPATWNSENNVCRTALVLSKKPFSLCEVFHLAIDE